ncbi:MAG: hypothetical protein QG597_4633 [Actinomycetota bacterium]|nr:hypothetical protein [Actinomycetota bacterium]
MGIHAQIRDGRITIDTLAWLEHRTAGEIDNLTRDLWDWAEHPDVPSPVAPQGNRQSTWSEIVLSWCVAHGYASPDPTDPDAGPDVIVHSGTRLDTDLWIARARTVDHGPIAVVQLGRTLPIVHTDYARDIAEWFDADTVELFCPNRHGWTWRTGRELINADGDFTTISVVFGPDLDMPFTWCKDCLAHREGTRAEPCDCTQPCQIICPLCGQPCDVELPSY